MSDTATPKPDLTRWTGEKATVFLKALARSGKVAPAARAVGMSRQAAYRLRARAPKFAEFWDIAMRDAASARAARKARGRRKPVHPLLDTQPFAQEVTPPSREGDTPAHHASDTPRAQSHTGRAG